MVAYDSQNDYKARTKLYHDKHIVERDIKEGDQALLHMSKLKLMPGKLRSQWTGPFKIIKIFPHGAVELELERTGEKFKVNGQRVKLYLGGPIEQPDPILLREPVMGVARPDEDAQVAQLDALTDKGVDRAMELG